MSCLSQYSARWCFVLGTLLLLVIPLWLNVALDGQGESLYGRPALACKIGDDHCKELDQGMHWCERIHWNRFMRTSFNAITAVAFPVTGLAILCILGSYVPDPEVQNHARRHLHLSATFAMLCFWGGLASFYNHAAVTRFSREPDRASVWAMLIPVLVFSLLRCVPPPFDLCSDSPDPPGATGAHSAGVPGSASTTVRLHTSMAFYSCINLLLWTAAIVAAVFHMVFGELQIATIAVYAGLPTLGFACVVPLLVRPWINGCRCCPAFSGPLPKLDSKCRWAVSSLFLFTFAFACVNPRTLEGGTCNPDGPLWKMTHGYWHILMAASLWSFWWFIWTENELKEQDAYDQVFELPVD